ncbi:MAG: hypothetical protein R2877_05595 [Bdellovibrionota bacterium]
MEISNTLEVSVALLTYAETNCTSSYELSDGNGNPVTEAQLVQQMSEETVENIPTNFYVIKTTSIATSASSYSILFLNDSEFFSFWPSIIHTIRGISGKGG